MSDTLITHSDLLGNEIKVGDVVALPAQNSLYLGIVKKLNPKMVSVARLNKHSNKSKTMLKYPHELLVVNDPKTALYMLAR